MLGSKEPTYYMKYFQLPQRERSMLSWSSPVRSLTQWKTISSSSEASYHHNSGTPLSAGKTEFQSSHWCPFLYVLGTEARVKHPNHSYSLIIYKKNYCAITVVCIACNNGSSSLVLVDRLLSSVMALYSMWSTFLKLGSIPLDPLTRKRQALTVTAGLLKWGSSIVHTLTLSTLAVP